VGGGGEVCVCVGVCVYKSLLGQHAAVKKGRSLFDKGLGKVAPGRVSEGNVRLARKVQVTSSLS